jgi:hypothetical protein
MEKKAMVKQFSLFSGRFHNYFLPLNFLYPHPVTQQSVYIIFLSPLDGKHMGR